MVENSYRCCFIISSALISCTHVISQAQKVPKQCVCKGQTAQTKLKAHRGLLSRTQMSHFIDQSTTDGDCQLAAGVTLFSLLPSVATQILCLCFLRNLNDSVAPVLTLFPGAKSVRILIAVFLLTRLQKLIAGCTN